MRGGASRSRSSVSLRMGRKNLGSYALRTLLLCLFLYSTCTLCLDLNTTSRQTQEQVVRTDKEVKESSELERTLSHVNERREGAWNSEASSARRQLQCSGYWGTYGACKNGKKCRTYQATVQLNMNYFTSYTPFTLDFSGLNLGSWNWYGRRNLLCTATGTEQCTTTGCAQPVNCVGAWGEYGACNGVEKCKFYIHSKDAKNGGASCPYSNFHKECEKCADEVNCSGVWTPFSACKAGKKCRKFKITQYESGGGKPCFPAVYDPDYKDCTTSGCSQPVDCVGAWGAYGSCKKGQKCRHYKISTAAANGGAGCPYANLQEDCTKTGCAQPVDCAGALFLSHVNHFIHFEPF